MKYYVFLVLIWLCSTASLSNCTFSVDAPWMSGTRMRQPSEEQIFCSSYHWMSTEMHSDGRDHLVPQQKYPPGCQKGFSHIMRILCMTRLLYPAGPKPFILEECQKARKLRSCSSRGLQVQNYCVVPLNLFFFPGALSLLNGVRTVQPVTKRQLHLPFSSEGSPVCDGNYASQPPWPGSILHVNW